MTTQQRGKHARSPFTFESEGQREFTEKLVDQYMFAPDGQPAGPLFPAIESRLVEIAERCQALNEADAALVRAATLDAVAGMQGSLIGWHEFLTAIVSAIAAALNLLEGLRT